MEFFVIFVAILVAVVLSLLVKRRIIIEAISLVVAVIVFWQSIAIAIKVAKFGPYTSNNFFSVDALGAIVVLIVALSGLAAVAYSVTYLREETSKNIIGFTRVKQYFILLNIFLGGMFLAILSSSPIITWISIEATTLSTAFLISFYNKPSAMEAAWKYLIINSVGLLLGFFGTLLYLTSLSVVGETGLVTWNSLIANVANLDPVIAKIAFIFVFIGYGTKVGLAPMHTWKPDAYSKAPAPIGALFSGALLPVSFVTVLKFKIITDLVVGSAFSGNLFIIFGVLSIAVASLIIFSAKNYKRLLAYSSIEHAGVMAIGFGFGGLGSLAATLHMVYHSLIKSSMFFLAGNMLLKYGSDKIMNVRGVIKTLPLTGILFLVCFFAITGTPPFGMFITKIFILTAGMQNHPLVIILVIILMALLFIGFFKHATAVIFGEKPAEIISGETNVWLIIPPLALIVMVFYLSIYIPLSWQALLTTAASLY